MNCNCDRCDKFLYAENVTFPCGFRAQLCNGCMNEIEVSGQESGLNAILWELLAKVAYLNGRASAGDPPSLEEWMTYTAAKAEFDHFMFKFFAAQVATKPKTTGGTT